MKFRIKDGNTWWTEFDDVNVKNKEDAKVFNSEDKVDMGNIYGDYDKALHVVVVVCEKE